LRYQRLTRWITGETATGVALFLATILALVWANSRWAPLYEAFREHRVAAKPLAFWIDDGLMTVFFFSAGLEIRREVAVGALADMRRAALPIAAAAGGMLVPALVFLALNRTGPGHRGWGIPTATDIAFAVAVVALLAKRLSPSLRVLLLALAIIDDIGAILVIAFFYSSGVAWSGVALAGLGMVAVLGFQRAGVRRPLLYVAPGAVVWVGLHLAHVHPTIAGVLLGLVTPVALTVPLQARLQRWIAFGIMPLFALANAGVTIGDVDLRATPNARVLLGAGLGLLVGKPLGICIATFASLRLGLCRLPEGLGRRDVLLLGVVAGVGFTMAIFIAGLAFADSPGLLAAAKLGVLLGSGGAGLAGYVLGSLAKR